MVVQVERNSFRLLIADDNRAYREILRELLTDGSMLELYEAESGEQALEVVQRQRIDIVLLDMHMHVMSGLETLRVLKQMDAVRPCILITSDTSEELRRDAREAHAFSVLKKPVLKQQLVNTVSNALAAAYHRGGDLLA